MSVQLLNQSGTPQSPFLQGQAVAIARRMRFGVSIEREIGFGGFIGAQRVLRVPGVGRTKQKV